MGSWLALELSPPRSITLGPVPSAPVGGTAAWAGVGEGKQRGPRGPWLCGRKKLTSEGVTLLLYRNRALEQTLVKMPVPWAGLAPCPLPPQQTAEPAYPTSPAFPPLSCLFASRVVYQDGFYGAEIYVSAAPRGRG